MSIPHLPMPDGSSLTGRCQADSGGALPWAAGGNSEQGNSWLTCRRAGRDVAQPGYRGYGAPPDLGGLDPRVRTGRITVFISAVTLQVRYNDAVMEPRRATTAIRRSMANIPSACGVPKPAICWELEVRARVSNGHGVRLSSSGHGSSYVSREVLGESGNGQDARAGRPAREMPEKWQMLRSARKLEPDCSVLHNGPGNEHLVLHSRGPVFADCTITGILPLCSGTLLGESYAASVEALYAWTGTS
jgi:hypothetical protein